MLYFNKKFIINTIDYGIREITSEEYALLSNFHDGYVPEGKRLAIQFNTRVCDGFRLYRLDELKGNAKFIVRASTGFNGSVGLNLLIQLLYRLNGGFRDTCDSGVVNTLLAYEKEKDNGYHRYTREYLLRYQNNMIVIQNKANRANIICDNELLTLRFPDKVSEPIKECIGTNPREYIMNDNLKILKGSNRELELYAISKMNESDAVIATAELYARELSGEGMIQDTKVVNVGSESVIGAGHSDALFILDGGFVLVLPKEDYEGITKLYAGITHDLADLSVLRDVDYLDDARIDLLSFNVKYPFPARFNGMQRAVCFYGITVNDNGSVCINLASKSELYKREGASQLTPVPALVLKHQYCNGVYSIETLLHDIYISGHIFENQEIHADLHTYDCLYDEEYR